MSAADDYFKKAEVAAKKQNYEYAIELFLQGLILNPKAADERRKMHACMTVAIQEKGGNPQGGMGTKLKVMPILANVKKLTMQKKWDEAAVEVERALRQQPHSVPTLFTLASILEVLEAYDGAIGVLEDLTQIDKAHVEAYRKLGVLWAKKDEPEKAIEFWQKVQLYKPDDKEAGKAIRDLSAATMVKKSEERKKLTGNDSFTALLKSEEESSELEKKAKIIRTDDDRREAIEFKKDELRKDSGNSRLWRELGSLYQDLKDWSTAEKAFRRALKVNPHDLFAQEKIGALRELSHEEDLKRIEAECLAAEEAGQDAASLRERLEARRVEFKNFRVDEYERRVKAHPTDYEMKLRFGEVLMDVGKLDDAIEQFQKAVKDPKFRTRSLTLIGTCFREKGLYDVATQQFKQALDGLADKESDLGKVVQYNLGIVSEKKRDKEGALKWYQNIMAADIGYKDVSSRVSKLMSGTWPD